VNILLSLAGLQNSILVNKKKKKRQWEVTPKGKEFAQILDTGKMHSSGTPIQQVKWYKSVLPKVQEVKNEMLE